MLSYRHAFHAGNFADILKHLVLVNALQYAARKEAPLFYLDTHAGAGLYRLRGAEAARTGEAAAGVLKLDGTALQALADAAGGKALQAYFDAVQPFLRQGKYPGSPLLAAAVLRRADHLHLCELHPADFAALQELTRHDRRVRCEQQDGYTRAPALLPPAQKRALVLIDPSYEEHGEMKRAAGMMADLHRRMPSAQILLWYPVVNRRESEALVSALVRKEIRDLWRFELGVSADTGGHGMTAGGMLVCNPPWGLPVQLRNCLPLLQQQLAPEVGHWAVQRLTKE